jgi:hypothetical protein
MVLQEANEQLIHLVRELLLHEVASLRDVGDFQVRREHPHDAVFQNGREARELVDVVFLPHDDKHRDLELWILNRVPLME